MILQHFLGAYNKSGYGKKIFFFSYNMADSQSSCPDQKKMIVEQVKNEEEVWTTYVGSPTFYVSSSKG